MAWHYSKNDFRHRIVYLQERNEASGTVHPVRLLISEGKLVRIITVNEGGIRRTKRIVAKGPIAAISTTTKNQLEIDDETRHISVWVDETPEQTRRIVLAACTQLTPVSREELRVWREAHKLIETRAKHHVVVSKWFEQIAEAVYDADVRVRRYFPAFVTACKAICLLRSFQGARYGEGEDTEAELEIDFTDFAVAAHIFESVFVESLHHGDERNLETRNKVEDISRGKNNSPVDATDLAKKLHISIDRAYARLRRAERAGMIQRVNKPEKTNRKLYLPKPRPRFLPDPKDLFNRIPELDPKVKFVDPFTNRWVVYQRARHGDAA